MRKTLQGHRNDKVKETKSFSKFNEDCDSDKKLNKKKILLTLEKTKPYRKEKAVIIYHMT